ncbi:MAG: lysine transporter LysE [Actinobacteria bacterium]|nr:MAG: lysine transporter LysE [Actinomycetota bacterium]
MEAFVAGLIAGYGIAIPVGAIAILIVQVGIKCGFRCAFAAGAGAATADFLYAGLAVIGGATLAGLVESVGDPLRIASGVVLAVIAVIGLRRSRNLPERPTEFTYPDRSEIASTYARFLGLTVINPTTVVYFAAVIIGLGVASDLTPAAGVVFVGGAFLASLSWQTLLAAVGSFARSRLTPSTQRLAVILGNLVILGLAVVILIP